MKRYDYANDNDKPAQTALNDLDAILARLQDIFDDLGDVPYSPYCD